jgi:S-adenosylmethionine decarboxylase
MPYSTYGRLLVADAWGIHFGLINNVEFLKLLMVRALKENGATILSIQDYQFSPQGVTVLILLAESHLSIHTYPEKGFAALDCYTCGTSIDPQNVIEQVLSELKPKQIYTKKLTRGTGDIPVKEL